MGQVTHAAMIAALRDGDDVLAVALERSAPDRVGGRRPPREDLDAEGVRWPTWCADSRLVARVLAEEVLRLRGLSGRQGVLW